MKNISELSNCYGCGICAIICPTKIINIQEKSGFYQPVIKNQDKCINCGLCINVCAFINNNSKDTEHPVDLNAYSAWSNNKTIRQSSSSGGISYEIGKYLIEKGYNAIGVKYNTNTNRAEHFMAKSIEQFKDSIGSKYIPSFTIPGFSKINRKDKFFITGTPCQIDSVRRYLKKYHLENNFILLDFFCHGVPSMIMWRKYLHIIPTLDNDETISWRNKKNGWHNSWVMSITKPNCDNKERYFSAKSNGDLFYQMFLGHQCLSKACYKYCKYKQLKSAADIRIGDLWGDKFKNNKDGVSGVIAFTEQGNNLLSEISQANIIQLNKEASDIILSEQMKECAKKPWSYLWVKYSLQTHLNLKVISFIAKCICHIEKKLTK